MRLVGYCVGCRRFRYVRVDAPGMIALATTKVASGICHECEERERDEMRARPKSG